MTAGVERRLFDMGSRPLRRS